MSRFFLEPKINPAFKLWQPLPVLAVVPDYNRKEAFLDHAATLHVPCERQLDFANAKPKIANRAPVLELPRQNSLCKHFAFTGVS